MLTLGEFTTPTSFVQECVPLVTGKFALDIGSGIGRNSILFAKQGFLVDALDTNKELLEKLEKSAKEETLGIFCKVQDIRDIDLTKEYDVVIISFLLHFFDSEIAKDILTKVYKQIYNGGYLIIQAFDNKSEFAKMKGRENKFYPTKEELLALLPQSDILLEKPEMLRTVAGPLCSTHQLLVHKYDLI